MAHMTNPLATPQQIYQRSSFSAVPQDLQELIFFSTQCLTQAAGLLLQLPQSVTAQASVLIARYWLIEPILSHEFSDVSAAALYLTAKVGPIPRSPRDIANVYTYLLSSISPHFRPPQQPAPSPDPSTYTPSEGTYQAFHNRMLRLESRILYSLGFDTHVALPHPLAITYLQALDFFGSPKEKDALGGLVVRYLNTAMLSPQQLYVTHPPAALAVAAVYNAARDLGAKMPECAWWEVFDVDREELGFLVVGMRSVEGWAKKVREEGIAGGLLEGMVDRRAVETEMEKRRLYVRNTARDAVLDEVEEMSRMMDERIAEKEADAQD